MNCVDFKDIHIQKGENCFCSTVSNLLQYQQIDLSEEAIFFLSNGLQFKYDAYQKKPHLSPYKRFGFLRFTQLLEYLSQYTHIRVVKICPEEFANETAFNEKIYFASVDTEKLPYFKRSMKFVDFQPPHCIIVRNILGQIEVADSYVVGPKGDIETYCGLISKMDFLQAVEDIVWLNSHRYVAVNKETLLQTVVANLCSYLNGVKDGDLYMGKSAIMRSIEDLQLYHDLDDAQYIQMHIEMAFILRVNLLFINHYLQKIISSFAGSNVHLIEKLDTMNLQLQTLYSLLISTAYSKQKIIRSVDFAQDILNKEHCVLLETVDFLLNTD